MRIHRLAALALLLSCNSAPDIDQARNRNTDDNPNGTTFSHGLSQGELAAAILASARGVRDLSSLVEGRLTNTDVAAFAARAKASSVLLEANATQLFNDLLITPVDSDVSTGLESRANELIAGLDAEPDFDRAFLHAIMELDTRARALLGMPENAGGTVTNTGAGGSNIDTNGGNNNGGATSGPDGSTTIGGLDAGTVGIDGGTSSGGFDSGPASSVDGGTSSGGFDAAGNGVGFDASTSATSDGGSLTSSANPFADFMTALGTQLSARIAEANGFFSALP